MVTKEIKIVGMSCASCKEKIEKSLIGTKGVTKVNVKLTTETLYITYNEDKLNFKKIVSQIKSLGYDVSDVKAKSSNIGVILVTLFILAGLYTLNRLGVFSFLPNVSQNMSYAMLFVVGLLTSFHCIGMCGGITVSQCSIITSDIGKYAKLKPSILYNAGRVVSYTIIGGLVGALGQLFQLSGALKGTVPIIVGVFMILLGLKMTNMFPILRNLNLRLPKFITTGKLSKHGNFYVGLMNGLMPCGPLQTMQLYALGTGSWLSGALSMFFFSLGTVPLMFLLGVISTSLSANFRANMVKFGGIIVLVLGLVMVGRGLVMSNITVDFIGGVDSTAVLEENIQIVRSEITNNAYQDISVKAGIPLKWIITVKEGNLNGCNNPMEIPEYNITKELIVGENIIEFTPSKSGTVLYRCWMGMISGNIVVE